LLFFVLDQLVVNSYVVYMAEMENLVKNHMQFKIVVGRFLVQAMVELRQSCIIVIHVLRPHQDLLVHSHWQSNLRWKGIEYKQRQ